MNRPTVPTEFTSFGAFLKFLRRRAQLTQAELAIACGYSPPHISHLEHNQRLPDRATLLALFVPALGLEDEPVLAEQMLALAASSRRESETSRSQSAETISGSLARNHLPLQATPFVGRRVELEALARLLADPQIRLVTILGPGGMGKTRLSLEAAAAQRDHFANGVYFVSLAVISRPEPLIPTIAEAVGCPFYPGCEPKQLLLDFLREKPLLLVLDNFEHLLAGAALVTEILNAAPNVKILTTSRERLNLRSETVFWIDGLDIPDPQTPAEAAEFGAIQLFLQTARRLQPDFSHDQELTWIAQICRQVSGMPLGIELAAGWVDTLSVIEISREIEMSLDFLKTEALDMPTRQRSLQAVFDASWQRLDADERRVLTQLSVFRGGFTREAARQVTHASLENLSSLVSKSLLRRDRSGRFNIHELLRQYAESKLAATEVDFETARERHAVFYVDFMAARWNPLRSPQARIIAEEIESEISNIRSAWQFVVERRRTADIRTFTRLFWIFLDQRNGFAEGIELLEFAVQALRLAPSGETDEESDLALGLALAVQGNFYTLKGDPEHARALAQSGLSLLRRYHSLDDTLIALIALWTADLFLDNTENLKRTVQEALRIAEVVEDPGAIAGALYMSGVAHHKLHDNEEATRIGEDALRFSAESGDPFMLGICSGLLLARTARDRGDLDKAREYYLRGIEYFKAADRAYYMHMAYHEIVPALVAYGEFEQAGYSLQKALRFFTRIGLNYQVLSALVDASTLLAARGQIEAGVEVLARILTQPELLQDDQKRVKLLLASMQSRLAPAEFAAACERGKILDLETVVADLL